MQAKVLNVREVYVTAPVPLVRKGGRANPSNAALPDPDTGGVLKPRTLGGPEINDESGKDPRVSLFEWMQASENPFFARSFANRVWGHYFGVGVVNPVDDFSLANPPSNRSYSTPWFLDSKFDIRKLGARFCSPGLIG